MTGGPAGGSLYHYCCCCLISFLILKQLLIGQSDIHLVIIMEDSDHDVHETLVGWGTALYSNSTWQRLLVCPQ